MNIKKKVKLGTSITARLSSFGHNWMLSYFSEVETVEKPRSLKKVNAAVNFV
jgi:hypothetical protein